MAEIKVEVVRMYPINKGSLRAFASVSVGGKMVINSCRVVQQDGQKAWVALPQNESVGKDGKKKYFPIIELPDNVVKAIQAAVLEYWYENHGDRGGPGSQADLHGGRSGPAGREEMREEDEDVPF